MISSLWLVIATVLFHSTQSYVRSPLHTHVLRQVKPLNIGVKTYTIKDSPLNKLFIVVSSYLLQKISPTMHSQVKINFNSTFQDFVDITKDFLLLPPQEIKIVIINFLRSLIPRQVNDFFRQAFQTNPRQLCEQSSFFMGFGLLTWLVGPTERIFVDVVNAKGEVESWQSGVKIKECRYLAESGCKAACLHICRDPTQTFFAADMGMPIHMKPNFTDNSCEMKFGVIPPPRELDDIYNQPCFTDCGIDFKKRIHNKCS